MTRIPRNLRNYQNYKGTVSSEDASSVDSEEIENVSGVQQSTTQLFDSSKNSMELEFSENEPNLAEGNSEKASEIIPNAQDLQPIIIISDPIPVTSIINRVPAIYANIFVLFNYPNKF
ncbi:hypothetical protein C2G38_2039688 [Gigaspora rosea]|uniref:Uncharacterized protein n=1 Tax=Gigaspora rosea TaxID=44941 RepID=A0A397UZ78_9GLOM|nr:hypothetical protein C2G38_2039688 [Gigaspora rosea]